MYLSNCRNKASYILKIIELLLKSSLKSSRISDILVIQNQLFFGGSCIWIYMCTCFFDMIISMFLCVVFNAAPTKVEIVNEEEAKVVGELLPNRTVEDTVEIDSKTPSTKITVTKYLFSLSLVYMTYIWTCKLPLKSYIHVYMTVIQHCIPNYFFLSATYLF